MILAIDGDTHRVEPKHRRDAGEDCTRAFVGHAFDHLFTKAELILGLGKGEESHLHASRSTGANPSAQGFRSSNVALLIKVRGSDFSI